MACACILAHVGLKSDLSSTGTPATRKQPSPGCFAVSVDTCQPGITEALLAEEKCSTCFLKERKTEGPQGGFLTDDSRSLRKRAQITFQTTRLFLSF